MVNAVEAGIKVNGVIGSPRAVLDERNLFDAYPDGAWGEQETPGVRTVSMPGLKSEKGFRSAIRTGKPVRELIQSLHDMGEHVGLRWSANEITVFVAKNRNALIGAGVVGAAIGGAIYLTRRRSSKK